MTKREEMAEGATGSLEKAKPEEMLFEDYTAPIVVMEWIKLNFDNCSDEKLREAFECALAMKKQKKQKSC